jgi:putative peptide zinc metalloprotease protein
MAGLLKLSEKCAFFPYEGATDAEEYLLQAPGGRQFRVSPLAKEILESLDGHTSLDVIAQRLRSKGSDVTTAELNTFLEEQYGSLGVFANYAASAVPAPAGTAGMRTNPLLVFLHWRILPAGAVIRISRVFRVLFNGFVAAGGLLAIAVAHYWIYRREMPALIEDQTEVNLIFISGLALLSVLFHEFGHSSAVTRYGGSPGAIGFGLYLLMPSFYTDVSEVWRFPRRQRMVVDCAGVYFQQLVFCVFALSAYLTDIPEFAVACTLIDTMALITMNPVFQFDGYWFLVDYLGLPELQRLAWGQLRKWVLRAKDVPPLPPMRRFSQTLVLIYSIGCFAFFGLLLRMEYKYLFLPSRAVLGGLPKLIAVLVDAIKAREFMSFANHLLALFYFVAIPLSASVGLGIYAIRIFRYFAGRNAATVEARR